MCSHARRPRLCLFASLSLSLFLCIKECEAAAARTASNIIEASGASPRRAMRVEGCRIFQHDIAKLKRLTNCVREQRLTPPLGTRGGERTTGMLTLLVLSRVARTTRSRNPATGSLDYILLGNTCRLHVRGACARRLGVCLGSQGTRCRVRHGCDSNFRHCALVSIERTRGRWCIGKGVGPAHGCPVTRFGATS